MNKKILVHYVCRIVGEMDKGQIWGGTNATNYTIKKCFENDSEIDFKIKSLREFNSISEVRDWLNLADVSWLDAMSAVDDFYKLGYKRPDIVGIVTRSPVKNYGDGHVSYDKNWFYNGKVVRLNENEEKEKVLKDEFKGQDFISKISLVRHAIDLDTWKINPEVKTKKYVLWAGDKYRDAKNYPMWEQIQKITKLPAGYEFKTLSQYSIETYKMILDETAILVNTSKYESFCCAVNEARAKGVCTLVRKGLNGDIMFTDQKIQVEYTPEAYAKEIEKILKKDDSGNNYVEMYGLKNREWAEKNITLKNMRNDLVKVFKEVYKEKYGKNGKINGK